MIKIIPKKGLVPVDVKLLRSISAKGISEIKDASVSQLSVRDFEVFGSGWEFERLALAKIIRLVEHRREVPFIFYDSELREELSLECMRNMFDFWCPIELETKRYSDLENGYMSNLEGF